MIVPAWVDRTIATAAVTITDRYDTLTRVHHLSRTVDGRVVETRHRGRSCREENG